LATAARVSRVVHLLHFPAAMVRVRFALVALVALALAGPAAGEARAGGGVSRARSATPAGGPARARARAVRAKKAAATARARRPGIIATVGPRSSDRATLRSMMRGGMEVARINLSHNGARSAKALAREVRRAARAEGRRVPILFDLPGGKVRLGAMGDSPVTLRPGQRFELVPGGRERTTATRASVAYRDLARMAQVGERVLLDDGRLELEVTGVAGGRVQTRVVRGGELRSKMGLALAGRELRFPAMTAQDRRKLKIAVDAGADWIGVSMVQSARNLKAVRRALDRLGAGHVKVVAKIESRAALENLDEILDASDGVMIARGDLSVAVGAELPRVQERIARRARDKGVPFITASNLMSSMQTGTRPSAANRADVRRAARQGPRWLMLNETAMGRDPGRIVESMRAILTGR